MVVCGRSGIVSKTASETNPRVPSEPTSSRRKISSGVSASRKAQRRYPVVFLIANLRLIRSLSSGSARISSRIAARPRGQLGLGLGEALLGARRGGVDQRPRGQDEGERAQRRVGVVDDPAAHPARVVGDHAADRRRLVGGRVGAELSPVPGQHAVGVGEHGAGPHPCQGAVALDGGAGEVVADVDEDPVSLRLAVEAGPGRAQGDRDAAAARVAEDRRDLLGVAGPDDDLGEEPVGAGVGCVADQVQRPGQDPLGAEQPGEVAGSGCGVSRGQLLRGAVGGGAGRRHLRRAPSPA